METNLRIFLRRLILDAIAARHLDDAMLHAGALARLEPPLADDLGLAAVAHICTGSKAAALALAERGLDLDPHHLVCARVIVSHGMASERALTALCWHADTDKQALALLTAHVTATGQPQAFVRAGNVCCLVPGTAGLVQLAFGDLCLDEVVLSPADGVRLVTLHMPDPLRGAIDPVVLVDGRLVVAGAVVGRLLLPPRLTGLVEMLDDGNLQVRVLDRACPDRPLAVEMMAGEGAPAIRQVSVPRADLPVSDVLDAPLLKFPRPADGGMPRILCPLTGEPLTVPPSVAAGVPLDDGVVDVIVPVYGDLEATRACLAALLDQDAGAPMRVVAIDDAGPDPAIRDLLRRLASAGRITLVHNPGNLGFVRSVNIGMAQSATRDVVLLNADTVVAAGWLRRLRAAAYRGDGIGTVTPWSNDATICSYPTEVLPTALAEVDVGFLDRLAAQTLPGAVCDIPTAVGFCMYIRRSCLVAVGWFDADAFGTGYGEENDFCQRATQAGWRHVMALDTYVGHVGGGSFGAAKQARIKAALAILDVRYPAYQAEVHDFIARAPLRAARRALDWAQLRLAGARFDRLVVCAALGGGTERFVQEVVARYAATGRLVLLLRPGRTEGEGVDASGPRTLRLEVPGQPSLVNLCYDPVTELATLHDDLRAAGIRAVDLHHSFHLAAPALSALAGWFPYSVHVHDYSWICPRITLTTGDDRYCGEPADDAACDACVADHGDRLDVEGMPVGQWRALTRTILEGAQQVSSSCQDAAKRLSRYAPAARMHIQPAEDPVPAPPSPPIALSAGEPIRVLVPGAIGGAKGFDVLLACARDAATRQLPVRFRLMGYSKDDVALLQTGVVSISGRYKDEEVPALLATVRPHIAFLPSLWPETWCYALTHAQRAGLTVIAFDIGAQAERLRQTGGGVLLPLGTAPAAINDLLLTAAGYRP